MPEPIYNPLRPSGPLGNLLGNQLGEGQQASVLGVFPHQEGNKEVDAVLYQKIGGRVYPVDKSHLSSGDFQKKK